MSAYNCCSATCFNFSKNVHSYVPSVSGLWSVRSRIGYWRAPEARVGRGLGRATGG